MAEVSTAVKRRKIHHVPKSGARFAASQSFNLLAELIEDAIDNKVTASDSIRLCGTAPLSILVDRPEVALALAQEKTQSWPFKDVPQCWLRLCEDASLLVAAKRMRQFARELDELSDDANTDVETISNMLSDVVKVIDVGMSFSGQPRRSSLTKSCSNIMAMHFELPSQYDCSAEYRIAMPRPLTSRHKISVLKDVDIEQLQLHMNGNNGPLLLTGLIDDWPAIQKWHDPRYLLRATLDGRRIVLVEIGSSYADAAMQQTLMPIGAFLRDYILDCNATEIGYIAQHDLLGHVEMLSNDVLTPDICYTDPPVLSGSTSLNSELPPRRNVWIGPKGTKSPFHTDPDSNVYCQVVGYKYFRLIGSDQGENMYPRSTNELGLDLSNQSRVTTFSFAGRQDLSQIAQDFPLFAQASYREVILRPGDCLYIPARCWHYAESLSTSIGVNFWWT